MIKRLRFKNWRSLKDVTIDDLTPITVFIGANSSGKTNILDALYFLRHITQRGVVQAVFNWGGADKIHTSGVALTEAIELEMTYIPKEQSSLTWNISFEFEQAQMPFLFTQSLRHGNDLIIKNSPVSLPTTEGRDIQGIAAGEQHDSSAHAAEMINTYIAKRWQMLDENFMPPLRISSRETGDLYDMNRCADNLIHILDFMRKTKKDVYDRFQDDFTWLFGHVESLTTERNEAEARLSLRERGLAVQEAPTISAGTARVAAMLAAYYVLDIRQAELPGLLVIEEPDAALNPGILRNFVEQLREFTTGEHPRQIILTTHNPTFLNYFQPEEVRVVERDEEGYTHVKRVPEFIKDIWLDEHGLGEVWTTNSFGGLPW
jgi:predicted ATPase